MLRKSGIPKPYCSRFYSPQWAIHTKSLSGWNLNPLQNPASIHICVTLPTSSMIGEFVHDLKESIKIVRSDAKYQTEGTVALYGMSGSVPKGIIEEVVHEYLNTCYKVI